MADIEDNTTDSGLVELLDEAADILGRIVVPLYRDENGRPEHFGTGFFVRQGQATFLVSAAHVLEHGRELFYYVKPNVVAQLSGDVRLSKWSGDRENDPVDIGVLKLDRSAPPYPDVDKFALDASYLNARLVPREDKVYTIIGFPETKSRTDPRARQITSTSYSLRVRSIPDRQYAELDCSPEAHIVLSVDLRDGVDSTGQQRNFPKPQGMSGGPIFMLHDQAGRSNTRSFPIVGVGTKYRRTRNALIGTDVDIVRAMINEAV
jgi:hypothetical protein